MCVERVVKRALIVALVVLAGCSGGRTATRPQLGTTTAVSSVPPAGFVSAPPSNDARTLTEWGWDGRELRTLRFESTVDCCSPPLLSPDGTRLLVFDNGTSEILDVQGSLIARVPGVDGMWADDSRHLCSLQPHQHGAGIPEGPADLVLIDPGHSTRVVAEVSGYGPHSGPSVLRCSVRDDEAIVAENTLAMNVAITSVRLSNGVKTTPRWVPSIDSGEIVSVSGDGRYALEESTVGGPEAHVVDTTTGDAAETLAGQPEDLSWDGHLVFLLIAATGQQEAIDWPSRATVWRSALPNPNCPCPTADYALRTRPGTDDVALAVTNQPGQPNQQAALWRITNNRPALVARAVRYGIV